METNKLSVETAKGTISAQVNNDEMFPSITISIPGQHEAVAVEYDSTSGKFRLLAWDENSQNSDEDGDPLIIYPFEDEK